MISRDTLVGMMELSIALTSMVKTAKLIKESMIQLETIDRHNKYRLKIKGKLTTRKQRLLK